MKESLWVAMRQKKKKWAEARVDDYIEGFGLDIGL